MTSRVVIHSRRQGKRWNWLLSAVAYEGDACLLWPFGGNHGYGSIRDGGRAVHTHSVICALAYGPAPAGYEAAHSCGVRACCNKRHLRWDTRKGNAADREKHGTNLKLEGHPRAVLTAAQVLMIRASAETTYALAKKLGVSYGTARDARSGKNWSKL
jgi:hypothetical protein